MDDVRASSLLGLDEGGLAYWVACARELFEEAGLLLVNNEDGTAIDMLDAALVVRLKEHRRAINAGEVRFLDVLEREHLVLDATMLSYFAHWITPVGPPRRYDTRFFVALAPPDQIPVHDDKELVANTWVTPSEALERGERGEMQLILPTIKNLEAIERFSSSAALLEAAQRATAVPTIEPRIVPDGKGVRILLPGDDGYDEPDAVAARSVGNDEIAAASAVPAHRRAPSPLPDRAMGPRCVPGSAVSVHRIVTRLTAPNASMMTGPGTNTYVLGEDVVVVIDPGPPMAPHLDAVIAAIAGRPVTAVAVTHHHRDHAPAARALADAVGAPVVGFGHALLTVDVAAVEGTAVPAGDLDVVAWHTPGHASDHLCFFVPSIGWLFSGDHLMDGSTVVIAPPDGDLRAYLASIERVRDDSGIRRLAPGHGRLLGSPQQAAEEVLAHRAARAEVVYQALVEHGPATASALRPFAYGGVGADRDAVATATCWANLLAFVEDGRATSTAPRHDAEAVFAAA